MWNPVQEQFKTMHSPGNEHESPSAANTFTMIEIPYYNVYNSTVHVPISLFITILFIFVANCEKQNMNILGAFISIREVLMGYSHLTYSGKEGCIA